MSYAVRRAVKPGRKSFLIFAVGAVALVAGLIACNDTPVETVAPEKMAAAAVREGPADSNPSAFVGEGHNAMVDAVLRDVAKKRSKGKSQKKLCKLVEESAIEYARVTAKNPGEAMSLVKKQDFCAAPKVSQATDGASLRINIAEEYGLSGLATQLLNMTDYFVGVSYSASELYSYLAPINTAATSELDWEEAQIVTSATSVALSSFGYWTDNLAAWQAQFQPNASLRGDDSYNDARLTPKYSFWGGVKTVAKADLEGAISGGVGARIAKGAIPQAAMWIGGSKSLIAAINLM